MNQPSTKAVLFDLDGTLLNSIDGILQSFAHTLDTHLPGHGIDRMTMIRKIGEPLLSQMLQFSNGNATLAPRMVETYRRHNLAILPTFALYPGVHDTLMALRARRLITGLVTSKVRESTAISLKAHALEPLFDLILTADDTTAHKPHPEPLLEAARRLGLPPAAILYVGDSTHDIRCALGAGARMAAALWGPFAHEELLALQPHHALRDLTALLHLPELRGTLIRD